MKSNTVPVGFIANFHKKQQEFEQALNSVESLDKALPFYLEGLPFYQRVFASALANSLQSSMVKSGIQGLSFNQAKALLADK